MEMAFVVVVGAAVVARLALLQLVVPCFGCCGRCGAKYYSMSGLNFAGKWSRMSVCLGPVDWVVVEVVGGGLVVVLSLSGSSRW